MAKAIFLDSLLSFDAMATEARTSDEQCWVLCTDYGATHLTFHRHPLIFGPSARAALPEPARGGVHGGGLCGLWPLTFLFYVKWKRRGTP